MKNNQAFTLIELLVVVLIIGILAGVALPQYQKAVWKSRAAQLFTSVRSLATAQEAYYMANGTYATSFEELSLGFENLQSTTNPVVSVSTLSSDAIRTNDIMELSINSAANSFTLSSAFFKTGPYLGAGFIFIHEDSTNTLDKKIYCVERTNYISTAGSFCSKMWGTNDLKLTQWSARYYEMK